VSKKQKLASKLFSEVKISFVRNERSRISIACHLPKKDHRDDEGGEGESFSIDEKAFQSIGFTPFGCENASLSCHDFFPQEKSHAKIYDPPV
jgi:hypothetical protein